ncbi:MAG TPA: hypothetical protein VGQ26_16525 [Streptosporangiaceae bacterium]|nr:hypothetical protein [Streptosporangiaceae bacterium]
MTSEYAAGSIRITFAAAPQRPAGIAASFLTFLGDQRIYAGKGIHVHLGDPGALRSVAGAGLYLAVLALLAAGLGTLIRSTAGAVAAVAALVFVLPGLANVLPASWQDTVIPYLPSHAGQAIIGHTKFTPATPHLLPPGRASPSSAPTPPPSSSRPR